MDYQIMSEHLKNAARNAEEIAAKQIELDSILELVSSDRSMTTLYDLMSMDNYAIHIDVSHYYMYVDRVAKDGDVISIKGVSPATGDRIMTIKVMDCVLDVSKYNRTGEAPTFTIPVVCLPINRAVKREVGLFHFIEERDCAVEEHDYERND